MLPVEELLILGVHWNHLEDLLKQIAETHS